MSLALAGSSLQQQYVAGKAFKELRTSLGMVWGQKSNISPQEVLSSINAMSGLAAVTKSVCMCM